MCIRDSYIDSYRSQNLVVVEAVAHRDAHIDAQDTADAVQQEKQQIEGNADPCRSVSYTHLYGVQSLRAAENFHITGLSMHPEIINSLAQIKKAAAITNCEVGLLDKKRADAIVQACDCLLYTSLRA